MKRFILEEPHFIGGTLLAAGSIVNEAELGEFKKDGKTHKVEPGQFLIEVNAKGEPVKNEDRERLQNLGISAVPIEVAPVAPHAPNPTAPQALPPHGVGEVVPAGHFVAADGVESDEAAEARAEQTDAVTPKRRK